MNPSTCPLTELPDDILKHILFFLEPYELFTSIERLCVQFYNYMHTQEFLREIICAHLTENPDTYYADYYVTLQAACSMMHATMLDGDREYIIKDATRYHFEKLVERTVTVDLLCKSDIFHYAAGDRNNEQVVAIFIEKLKKAKKSVDIYYKKYTPLHTACFFARSNIVRMLVAAGASPFAKEGLYEQLPIHIAAAKDCLDAVKLFVEECGVDMNVQDRDGFTALRLSTNRRATSVQTYLADKGALF